MWFERTMEVTALAMIGEGMLGLIRPRRHLHLWNFGPAGYRKMVNAMEEHPDAMRLAFAAELGLGLLWGLHLVGECESAADRNRLEAKKNSMPMNEQPLETAAAI
ncbi:MAG TPA: hypothetical protein VGJ26_20885 [Pirellulales bacterium]|jgi:uncharacterized protein YjeT (DUF2065 family)